DSSRVASSGHAMEGEDQEAKRRRLEADAAIVVMPAPDMMMGMGRSMVTMMQFNEAKQDYTNSVANLDEDSAEYNSALLECHKRGADRCVKVASMHRGLYVKAAQFIASIRGGTGERGVPKPFIDALSVFTDQAPHKPISQIVESLKESMKLGSWPAEPLDKACDLKSIEEEPIAAASIAQVHQALLQDGTPVAVKVQYPELRKEMASDFAIFKTMGAQIKQMSGGYDLMWVVEDFEKNLSRELDFRLEAASCEETGKQLAHLSPSIYVPKANPGLIKCTAVKATALLVPLGPGPCPNALGTPPRKEVVGPRDMLKGTMVVRPKTPQDRTSIQPRADNRPRWEPKRWSVLPTKRYSHGSAMVNSLGLDGPAGGLRVDKKAKWDDWPPINACLVPPENNAELSEDQKAILRALYNDAELLRDGQMDEEQPHQLAALDHLYQDRIESHGFLRTHVCLEDLCNKSNKCALDEMTGLVEDVNFRTFRVSYKYRGLEISEQTVVRIRELSLPQRVVALRTFDHTSDGAQQDPDSMIRVHLKNMEKLHEENSAWIASYLATDTMHEDCSLTVVEKQKSTMRYLITDPPFAGHTIGSSQAQIAAMLPKELIKRLMQDSLAMDLNLDDWLSSTGACIRQQHASILHNKQLAACHSTEGHRSEARIGLDSDPAHSEVGEAEWVCDFKLQEGSWSVNDVTYSAAEITDAGGIDASIPVKKLEEDWHSHILRREEFYRSWNPSQYAEEFVQTDNKAEADPCPAQLAWRRHIANTTLPSSCKGHSLSGTNSHGKDPMMKPKKATALLVPPGPGPCPNALSIPPRKEVVGPRASARQLWSNIPANGADGLGLRETSLWMVCKYLCNNSNKCALNELTGLVEDVNFRTIRVSYKYRCLKTGPASSPERTIDPGGNRSDGQFFLRNVTATALPWYQKAILRALYYYAELLRDGQMDEEQPHQLAALDHLYLDRIESHGFLRTHVCLEDLCNKSNKCALNEMTGLVEDVNFCTFRVSYKYRGLEVSEQTVVRIRELSLPQRVVALRTFDHTSDGAQQDPDSMIRFHLKNMEKLREENSAWYLITDPPFAGHTIGSSQAQIAAMLPKELMKRLIPDSLAMDLNLDDWLSSTGACIRQQHASILHNKLLTACHSTEGHGSEARIGLGSDSAHSEVGEAEWVCGHCRAPVSSSLASTCRVCRLGGFPVRTCYEIVIPYKSSDFKLQEGSWSVNDVTYSAAEITDAGGTDASIPVKKLEEDWHSHILRREEFYRSWNPPQYAEEFVQTDNKAEADPSPAQLAWRRRIANTTLLSSCKDPSLSGTNSHGKGPMMKPKKGKREDLEVFVCCATPECPVSLAYQIWQKVFEHSLALQCGPIRIVRAPTFNRNFGRKATERFMTTACLHLPLHTKVSFRDGAGAA
ncbi:unnamed protein product, partial [Polarella glacialis]